MLGVKGAECKRFWVDERNHGCEGEGSGRYYGCIFLRDIGCGRDRGYGG